jgi:hypothetical protein
MFLVPAVVLGVALGLLLGGRPGRLADIQLRSSWLFFTAIVLQLVAFPSPIFPLQVPAGMATVLSVASYGCLVAVTAVNLRLPGMAIAGLGMVSNLVAIVANGGHMPALPAAMRSAGLAYDGVYNNSVADASPRLPWLVDRWAAPSWVPWGNVFSAGDVLLAAGVVVLVVAAMGVRWPRLRGRAPAADTAA